MGSVHVAGELLLAGWVRGGCPGFLERLQHGMTAYDGGVCRDRRCACVSGVTRVRPCDQAVPPTSPGPSPDLARYVVYVWGHIETTNHEMWDRYACCQLVSASQAVSP